MELIQGYDADGQPLIIPALAVAGALQDISGQEAEAMLRGLEMLDNTMTAALRDAEQAAHLATVIARSGLSPWDAHVAAVADASVCAILTPEKAPPQVPKRPRFHRGGLWPLWGKTCVVEDAGPDSPAERSHRPRDQVLPS